MEAIGFIRDLNYIGFGVPVYYKNEEYFVHNVNPEYRITSFVKVDLVEKQIIPFEKLIKHNFIVGKFCALVFYNNNTIIGGKLDDFLNEISEYLNDTGISNYFLINEIKFINEIVFFDKMNQADEIIRALYHPFRLQILQLIDSYGEIAANEIYKFLNVEQTVVSQHLSILRLAGIISTRKLEKLLVVSIDYQIVKKAQNALTLFYQNDSNKSLENQSKLISQYIRNL